MDPLDYLYWASGGERGMVQTNGVCGAVNGGDRTDGGWARRRARSGGPLC